MLVFFVNLSTLTEKSYAEALPTFDRTQQAPKRRFFPQRKLIAAIERSVVETGRGGKAPFPRSGTDKLMAMASVVALETIHSKAGSAQQMNPNGVKDQEATLDMVRTGNMWRSPRKSLYHHAPIRLTSQSIYCAFNVLGFVRCIEPVLDTGFHGLFVCNIPKLPEGHP